MTTSNNNNVVNKTRRRSMETIHEFSQDYNLSPIRLFVDFDASHPVWTRLKPYSRFEVLTGIRGLRFVLGKSRFVVCSTAYMYSFTLVD